jgi:hypothetical protein
MTHRTAAELDAALNHFRDAPRDAGTLELVVSRPAVDERKVLDEGELDLELGLVGDSWLERGNGRAPDGSADPDKQLNVMNARVAAFLAGSPQRRQRRRLGRGGLPGGEGGIRQAFSSRCKRVHNARRWRPRTRERAL